MRSRLVTRLIDSIIHFLRKWSGPAATSSAPSKADGANVGAVGKRTPSHVQQWLAAGVEGSWWARRRWRAVGREVNARKTLVRSATDDLVEAKLVPDLSRALHLAATDVLVEKAQKLLTRRAWGLAVVGFGTAAATLFLLGYAAYHAYTKEASDYLKGYDERYSKAFLTILLVKMTSISAVLFAMVYQLVSLSRAALHEMMVLYSRRHAMRFGRLYVYLKKGDLTLRELEDAFKWNEGFTSAFKDIKPDKMAQSIVSKLLDAPAHAVHAVGRLFGKDIAAQDTEHTPEPDRHRAISADKPDVKAPPNRGNGDGDAANQQQRA